MVLQFLNSTFESLHLSSLRNLTKKVLFLVSIAMAKQVGSSRRSPGVCPLSAWMPVSYVLEFVAKTESFQHRSLLILGEISCQLCGWFGGGLIMSCQGPAGLPLSDWVHLSFPSSTFHVPSASLLFYL